jgi:hypothetical protein
VAVQHGRTQGSRALGAGGFGLSGIAGFGYGGNVSAACNRPSWSLARRLEISCCACLRLKTRARGRPSWSLARRLEISCCAIFTGRPRARVFRRKPITTDAVAKIAHDVAEMNLAVNFENIWRKQELSVAFRTPTSGLRRSANVPVPPQLTAAVLTLVMASNFKA